MAAPTSQTLKEAIHKLYKSLQVLLCEEKVFYYQFISAPFASVDISFMYFRDIHLCLGGSKAWHIMSVVCWQTVDKKYQAMYFFSKKQQNIKHIVFCYICYFPWHFQDLGLQF